MLIYIRGRWVEYQIPLHWKEKKLERSLWHWCRQVDWCKAVDMLYACIRLRIFWILLPRLSKSKTSLVRLKLIHPSHEFRRKIVDFAAFFFVNTFGFGHTTIHLKTPLFNPLATQQLHRIRNLSAVRWITYNFPIHKKFYIFWTYCKNAGILEYGHDSTITCCDFVLNRLSLLHAKDIYNRF